MRRVHSHYEDLMVARNAPPEVIRAAYRSLSAKYHPDVNPEDPNATRTMTAINVAYRILSDEKLKKVHDEWIARSEAGLMASEAPVDQPTGNAFHNDDRNANATLAKLAGWIWALFGAWCVLILSVELFLPIETDWAWLLMSLGVSLAFLYLGRQTISGKAHDTLGNGIGSIVFGLFGLPLVGKAILNHQSLTAWDVGALFSSSVLLIAGVLALLGRAHYKRLTAHHSLHRQP